MVRCPSVIKVCLLVALLFGARRTDALIYCVPPTDNRHQVAPTGALANSGWHQTVPINDRLGTLIHSNALLTSKHVWQIADGQVFPAEGTNHTLLSHVDDSASDLRIFFFSPPVAHFARLNIETNDIGEPVVLQGRGTEMGNAVTSVVGTNGWVWGAESNIRRWGVNDYMGVNTAPIGVFAPGTMAIATFDNTGDPNECTGSPGDSGGPGFIRSGSGWKLATITYGVGPTTFTLSTNPVSEFLASLYDMAGLYYKEAGFYYYVPPEASPEPCVMANTRTVARIGWITNTVPELTFPADVGLAWRGATNMLTVSQAVTGLWFEVVASNAGPYTARDLAITCTWPPGLQLAGVSVSRGTWTTNRWTLPFIEDGMAATLRVDTVVWRAAAGWGTNHAVIAQADKPDDQPGNNTAALGIWLPQTAMQLMVQ